MVILKLELSMSLPVAVSSAFISSWLVSFIEFHCYIIMRLQIVMVPFALYICAMASKEKISSGNAETAFVNNCDHEYNYMVHI